MYQASPLIINVTTNWGLFQLICDYNDNLAVFLYQQRYLESIPFINAGEHNSCPMIAFDPV